MKLFKILLKTSIPLPDGNASSVISEAGGWEIDTQPSGVMATKGEHGVWIPLPEVRFGEFTPSKPGKK